VPRRVSAARPRGNLNVPVLIVKKSNGFKIFFFSEFNIVECGVAEFFSLLALEPTA